MTLTMTFILKRVERNFIVLCHLSALPYSQYVMGNPICMRFVILFYWFNNLLVASNDCFSINR